jgi:hypothetical protein
MNTEMSFERRALRHPSFAIGAALILLLLATAALSLIWTPWPPGELDIPHKLALPSAIIGCPLELDRVIGKRGDSPNCQTRKNRRRCEMSAEVWNCESGDRIQGCCGTCVHAGNSLAGVGG